MGNLLSLKEIRAIQGLFPDRWEEVFAMLQSLDKEAKRLKMREILRNTEKDLVAFEG